MSFWILCKALGARSSNLMDGVIHSTIYMKRCWKGVLVMFMHLHVNFRVPYVYVKLLTCKGEWYMSPGVSAHAPAHRRGSSAKGNRAEQYNYPA